MKTATGNVTYQVRVNCPNCNKRLNLTEYPYVESVDEDGEDYSLAEDFLGGELFGSATVPAKWSGFEIEYKCCGCNEPFKLNEFEI